MLSRFGRSIRAMRRLGEHKRQSKRDDTRGQIVRFRGEATWNAVWPTAA